MLDAAALLAIDTPCFTYAYAFTYGWLLLIAAARHAAISFAAEMR